jgi:hypothetical protein
MDLKNLRLMLTPDSSLFENDIDVVVPKRLFLDVQELADIYGLSYKVLQRSDNEMNVCIVFEEDKAEKTMDFINDVNIIKNN